MNNAVCGKTIEKWENMVDINLINNKKDKKLCYTKFIR